MSNNRIYPGSLHNHTDYSNLRLRDAINTCESLIDYAISLGHEVIAITEHETVANALKIEKYYNKIKKNNPNFKVILGNEIYLCRDGLTQENYDSNSDGFWHYILLAKDAIGHQQIRELSTRAWQRSWKQGKMRRVPTYYNDLIEVIYNNQGHVIGSTACLGGCLPKLLLQEKFEEAEQWCLSMIKLFGEGNFYLEMQPSHNKEQIYVNNKLIELGNKLNIPYIITTDSHYLTKEDRPIHKAFLTSQEGEREVDDFYATTYLMSTEEIEEYMEISEESLEKSYENIRKIKNMCEDYSLAKPLKIPQLTWKRTNQVITDDFFDAIPFLKTFYESSYEGDKILAENIVYQILKDKHLQNKETYDEVNDNLRITWESSNVNNTHWSAYFLNLQKIIDVCWEAGSLVGAGRGSGVGFILLYILGITQINPLRETTQTYSWRFLNPERVSVLDVDVDIEGSKRSNVLNKLREVYGYNRVANVATFGTEKAKSAILTACRGLNIDVDIAQYLASFIQSDRGQARTLKETYYGDKEKDFLPNSTFRREMDENYPEVWRVAQYIEGLVCRLGEHAGGVIFVDEDFTNSTALMRVPNDDIITQFDLHDCEDVSQ